MESHHHNHHNSNSYDFTIDWKQVFRSNLFETWPDPRNFLARTFFPTSGAEVRTQENTLTFKCPSGPFYFVSKHSTEDQPILQALEAACRIGSGGWPAGFEWERLLYGTESHSTAHGQKILLTPHMLVSVAVVLDSVVTVAVYEGSSSADESPKWFPFDAFRPHFGIQSIKLANCSGSPVYYGPVTGTWVYHKYDHSTKTLVVEWDNPEEDAGIRFEEGSVPEIPHDGNHLPKWEPIKEGCEWGRQRCELDLSRDIDDTDVVRLALVPFNSCYLEFCTNSNFSEKDVLLSKEPNDESRPFFRMTSFRYE